MMDKKCKHNLFATTDETVYCDKCGFEMGIPEFINVSFEMLEVLEELLEVGSCYHSAIEIDTYGGGDGEEWEIKARTIIAKINGE